MTDPTDQEVEWLETCAEVIEEACTHLADAGIPMNYIVGGLATVAMDQALMQARPEFAKAEFFMLCNSAFEELKDDPSHRGRKPTDT